MTGVWGLIVGSMVAAYLVGSLPVGLWVGLLRGVDIRTVGSGNVGATNVYRALGLGPALAVFAGDTLKGWLPVWAGMGYLAPALQRSGLGRDAACSLLLPLGMAAIAGHSFSVFLRFKGGRGVATALGMLLALSWRTALGALGVWVLVMLIVRIVSLASILAVASAPILMWQFREPRPFLCFVGAVAALVIGRHAPNIRRLARGEEKRISRLSAGAHRQPPLAEAREGPVQAPGGDREPGEGPDGSLGPSGRDPGPDEIGAQGP